MARCKKCPTILRSENHTGYCSICEPPPAKEKTLFFPYAENSENKQWGRFSLNIYTKIAGTFSVTVKTLEDKSVSAQTDAHIAVYLLLTELFHISVKHISRYMKIPIYQLEAALQKARESHCHDAVFQKQYREAKDHLLSMGHNILPKCADPAVLPAQDEPYEEFNPYVRFVRTMGKPSGSIKANIVS